VRHSDANAAAPSDAQAVSAEVVRQTNKRHTLNLLIQGAAAHTLLTAHHLVADQLEAVRPGLTRLYDRMAIVGHLNYWMGDIPILFGPPSRFWRRTGRPNHPFRNHALLARHGAELSRASKRYLLKRGWKRWVIGVPVIQYVQLLWLLGRVWWAERGHEQKLARLAVRANSLVWGIEEDRQMATLTSNVAFGYLQTPQTFAGRIVQNGAAGYGGVERVGGRFRVVGKAWNFPFVLHELSKGTAELVCLHGLNTLDDETYTQVTAEADQIEYETWALQAGPEMWRRLLAVLPADRPLAEMLMHIARLDPEPLEELMLAVVNDPDRARRRLRWLGD
jgi:hypothetical protein